MNRPVKICMVGAGRVGVLHAGTLRPHLSGGEPAALVDSSPQMLKSTGDAFGIDLRFASLDEALDRAEFDAVIITTPTFTHKPLALAAAARSKHIFLEKPMAMSA